MVGVEGEQEGVGWRGTETEREGKAREAASGMVCLPPNKRTHPSKEGKDN